MISFIWVSEGAAAYSKSSVGHLGAALLETLVFYYGIRLRASLSCLSDKDLTELLVETVLRGGLKTVTSVLFVLF